MSKIVVDLNIEKLVDQLNMDAKIRLIRKLENETLNQRMDNLLSKIDSRSRNNPISEEDITREIEAVRREIYGKSRS